jgi:uncharacterized membrane protein YfcA
MTLLLIPLFALVAAAYASVGLGGGTGYLALMTLFGVPHELMPSTALALNIVVTSVAILRFGSAGKIRWGLFLPFLISALPAAFVGGMISVPRSSFMGLLAVGLILASVAMFRSAARDDDSIRHPKPLVLWTSGIVIGTAIGLVSGMLGIGGGVFLGPFLLLARWATPRETAAITSMTVLTLSIAGLAAHGVRGNFDLGFVAPLALAVLVGGLVGAHLSVTRFTPTTLKRLFAVIILIAAIKAAVTAIGGL